MWKSLFSFIFKTTKQKKPIPIFNCFLCRNNRVMLEGGYEDPRNEAFFDWKPETKAPLCIVCKTKFGCLTVKEVQDLIDVNQNWE